jgi:hypothetical protein
MHPTLYVQRKQIMSIHRWKKHLIQLALSTAACVPLLSLAADSKPGMPEPSKEQREKMALVHEKIAACLRSDRSFEDCHHEMQSSHAEAMGKEHCPMMERKMKGHQHSTESEKDTTPPANP